MSVRRSTPFVLALVTTCAVLATGGFRAVEAADGPVCECEGG